MRIKRRETPGGVIGSARGGKAREALGAEPPRSGDLPFDPEKDLPIWKVEGLSRAQLAALARLKPELTPIIRGQVGSNHLFESIPGNYSVEDHRGSFSFTWLLWAADNIQIFPEMRKQTVPGLGKTYQDFVFDHIRQSVRPDTQQPPFELNLAIYYKAFLELCPQKRSEIESLIRGSQLYISVEMYLNGEVEEHTNEFNLDPKSGWVQGFAAAKVLFPDLAGRITEFFDPHWAKIKENIQGMRKEGPEVGYVSAASILGAETAWIDEQGQFHLKLPHADSLQPTKSLPERPIL